MRWLPVLVIASIGCGGDDKPTCGEMAEHVNKLLGEDQQARELQKQFELRCIDDRWSKDMRACVLKTTSTESPQNCRIYLNDHQQQRWDAVVAGVAADDARRLPASCVAYEGLVETAQKCDALSADVRKDLATNLAARKPGWEAQTDKSSVDAACASAARALRSAAPGCFNK